MVGVRLGFWTSDFRQCCLLTAPYRSPPGKSSSPADPRIQDGIGSRNATPGLSRTAEMEKSRNPQRELRPPSGKSAHLGNKLATYRLPSRRNRPHRKSEPGGARAIRRARPQRCWPVPRITCTWRVPGQCSQRKWAGRTLRASPKTGGNSRPSSRQGERRECVNSELNMGLARTWR